MTACRTPGLSLALLVLAGCSLNDAPQLADTARASDGTHDGVVGTLDRGTDAASARDRGTSTPDTGKKPPPPKDGGKPPAGDKGPKPLKDWGVTDAGTLAYQCLWNTKSEGECKDCCDCIGLACTDTAPCRDSCPTHDFTKNTSFITVTVKSTLGPNGNYSVCTAKGTQKLCKDCCACGANLDCGDTRYCRDQCNKLPIP